MANPRNCAVRSQATSGNNGNTAGYFPQDITSAMPYMGHNAAFACNSLNRLTHAAANSGFQSEDLTFSYDRWGNMSCVTKASTNGPCANWTFDTNKNQINTSGFQYDLAGNLTTDGSFSYTWDAEGRMKTAGSGTYSVAYTYDGDGKRVAKVPNSPPGPSQLYWYGTGSDPLLETDLNGNLQNEYIFFGGKRIARRDATGNVNYYFSDHLGSSRVVTNAAGGILDDCDFTPFGQEHCVSSSSGNSYKFTGKERDPIAEGGKDYFPARYYVNGLGRWLSPDEYTGGPTSVYGPPDPAAPGALPYADITNPQSLNKYAYGYNNPTRYIDPTGRWPWDWFKRLKGRYTMPPPPPPLPPSADVAKLVVAQDRARANPNFAPQGRPDTPERRMFCNVATRAIAKETGHSTKPLQGRANEIAGRVADGTSESREVQANQVIRLANEGEFVVGVQPHDSSGHIVRARPTVAGFGSFVSVDDPPVNDIGAQVRIAPALTAFCDDEPISWYVIE